MNEAMAESIEQAKNQHAIVLKNEISDAQGKIDGLQDKMDELKKELIKLADGLNEKNIFNINIS